MSSLTFFFKKNLLSQKVFPFHHYSAAHTAGSTWKYLCWSEKCSHRNSAVNSNEAEILSVTECRHKRHSRQHYLLIYNTGVSTWNCVLRPGETRQSIFAAVFQKYGIILDTILETRWVQQKFVRLPQRERSSGCHPQAAVTPAVFYRWQCMTLTGRAISTYQFSSVQSHMNPAFKKENLGKLTHAADKKSIIDNLLRGIFWSWLGWSCFNAKWLPS